MCFTENQIQLKSVCGVQCEERIGRKNAAHIDFNVLIITKQKLDWLVKKMFLVLVGLFFHSSHTHSLHVRLFRCVCMCVCVCLARLLVCPLLLLFVVWPVHSFRFFFLSPFLTNAQSFSALLFFSDCMTVSRIDCVLQTERCMVYAERVCVSIGAQEVGRQKRKKNYLHLKSHWCEEKIPDTYTIERYAVRAPIQTRTAGAYTHKYSSTIAYDSEAENRRKIHGTLWKNTVRIIKTLIHTQTA